MAYTADPRLGATPDEIWYLEALFTPGSRLGAWPSEPETVVEVAKVVEVATIRIPSGRLVVDSPWPAEGDSIFDPPVGRELTERLPVGAFRLEAAMVEVPFPDVIAMRLRIVDDPVVAWEMALGLEDDVERLAPGARIGFNSETNMASFADAAAWVPLTEPFRRFWQAFEADPGGGPHTRDSEGLGDHGIFERVGNDAQGADLVTFPAEGGYVVWLGRARTGGIASVVAASEIVPGRY